MCTSKGNLKVLKFTIFIILQIGMQHLSIRAIDSGMAEGISTCLQKEVDQMQKEMEKMG